MGKKAIHILLIEDNAGDARLIEEMLDEVRDQKVTLTHSRTFSEGREELGRHTSDVILLDFGLPDSSGLESLSELIKLAPNTPVVMLTGLDDEKTAVSTLHMGAQDYLVKGRLDSSLLMRSMRYAIERKRAEESLRESEAQHRVLLQTAMDGFWRVDMQGRIVEVNESYCRMSGYSEQELLAMRISDLEVIETDDEIATHSQKIVAQGEDRFESRHHRKDGSIFNVEVSVQYRPTDGGQFVGFLRDITGRKQVEEALRKAKDELEVRVQQRTADLLVANEMISASNTVLQLFPQALSIKEYLDSVVAVVRKWSNCNCLGIRLLHGEGNMPYESYVGYSKKFLESENCLSINTAKCICSRVMTGSPEPRDAPFMSLNGTFCCNNFLEFIGSLTEEEKKRYYGTCVQEGYKSIAVIPVRYKNNAVGVFHLANEREGKFPVKCIEFIEMIAPLVGEAIHKFSIEEDRARLMAAAESALDAIVITDIEGRIQYANPAFERITGYSREEILGRDLHILDSGSHDESIYQAIRAAVRRGMAWNGLLVSKKKDGALYQEECTIAPVKDCAGRISNYVTVRRDVTEKLRLESIAAAVDTMNNIGYVFSGIRHEIGNPVNSMKMALNLLYLNLNNYSKETVGEYIERILDELSRVEYLLYSFKTFNMYETPELQNIRVREFLEKFLSLSKSDYEEKGIAITSSVGPDADCCYADPRALQQVVLNIFTNAIDACEGKANPEISFTASRTHGMIRLNIADNGRGMTEEQRKNAFRPFYTTKTHGTGLGLVIAKKMLAKMSATIEVHGALNEGTEVDIFIPEGGE